MLMKLGRLVIDFISWLIHPFVKITGRNKLRILCYHRVYDLKANTNTNMASLCVEPGKFDKQMDYPHKKERGNGRD